MFPGLKVPDYRGAYLRGAGLNANGWGSATSVAGDSQDDKTRMPVNPFTATTNRTGDHKHEQGYVTTDTRLYRHGYRSLNNRGFVSSNDLGTNYQDLPYTSTDGAHSHTVTVAGGDPETRPKTFVVEYIIKATDVAMVARP